MRACVHTHTHQNHTHQFIRLVGNLVTEGQNLRLSNHLSKEDSHVLMKVVPHMDAGGEDEGVGSLSMVA